MARKLRDYPPTSSAARFLDTSVAARAMQPGGQQVPLSGPSRTEPSCTCPPPQWVKREFTLTLDADCAFTRLVGLLRTGSGTKLNNSHVLRAIIHAVEPAFEAVRNEVGAAGPFRLPGNGKGFESQRREFEAQLIRALRAGLRADDVWSQPE